jgi:hypothetical protein
MREILSCLPEGTLIVHGGAPGADRMAGSLALKLGLCTPIVYPAQWKTHGKAAGPIRNRLMLDEEKPDLVIAFWDGESPGTKDMIEETERRHIELWKILPG